MSYGYKAAIEAAQAALVAANEGPWPLPGQTWDPWAAAERHLARVERARNSAWKLQTATVQAAVALLRAAHEEVHPLGPYRQAPSVPVVLGVRGWPVRGRQSQSGRAVLAAAIDGLESVLRERQTAADPGMPLRDVTDWWRLRLALGREAIKDGQPEMAWELAGTVVSAIRADDPDETRTALRVEAVNLWADAQDAARKLAAEETAAREAEREALIAQAQAAMREVPEEVNS